MDERRSLPWQAVAALAVLGVPLAVLVWLLADQRQNAHLHVPFEHFVIVTNVSLLALAQAALLARAAMQSGQHSVLLLALGFTSLAGLFSIHGLATPGVLTGEYLSYTYGSAPAPGYADSYDKSVIGMSAYLSLLVPSMFFASRYSGFVSWLDRRGGAGRRALVGVVGAGLLLYAWAGLWQPELLQHVPLTLPPLAYLSAGATVLLLLFAAWRQASAYVLTRLPMQGALVLSFLLLAEAQMSMVLTGVWSLAWWEYHLMMLLAVVLALGALFVELDRRRGLERFLPGPLVERVLTGAPIHPQGERRVVTVLFADLRGSTAIAEHLPAERVVEFLNSYVGAMARPVFEHGGMLDKFMGDGLMAIFGLLDDGSDGAVSAARSVHDMRKAIQAQNEKAAARGQVAVRFGVGINTGEVVLGAVGLPERSDFTAVGDTVNTSARLQDLCKQFDVDSVMSAETAERLRGTEYQVRPLGRVEVRGRTEPVDTYTLG